MKLPGWLKSALLRGAEIAGAVVLVLVFFLTSLAILALSFPEGTSIQDLVRGSGWSGEEYESPVLDLQAPGGGPARPRYVARLTELYRKVKDKRANGIVWGDSLSGTPLEARHAIQTYDRAEATIAFDGKSQVTLGENSLMVIRDTAGARSAPGGNVPTSLIVTEGGLHAFGGGEGGQPLEIVTGAGTSRITGGKTTDLKVTNNPDRSSTFSVYSGAAEVTNAGRTVPLRANQTVTVERSQPPGEPQELPAAPTLLSPEAGGSVPFRTVPPRLRLAWEPAERARGYRVDIARDPQFRDLADQEKGIDATEFVHGNLPAGTYYWRVAGLLGFAEGPPSATRRVEIVKDLEPPLLQVEFPRSPVLGERVVLRGEAERGAQVFIGHERVPTDEGGRFEFALGLAPGPNVVVVEALDAAGNASYRSGLLSAKQRE